MNENGSINSNRVEEIKHYLQSEINRMSVGIENAKIVNCLEAYKYLDGRKDAYEHIIAILECNRVYN